MHTRRPPVFRTIRMAVLRTVLAGAACLAVVCSPVQAQPQRPNILVIMGDDIGWFNPQCLSPGHDGLSDPEYRPHCPGRGMFGIRVKTGHKNTAEDLRVRKTTF